MRILRDMTRPQQQEARRTCTACKSLLGVQAHDLTYDDEAKSYAWYCGACGSGNKLVVRGVPDWMLKAARDKREYVTSGRAERDRKLADSYRSCNP